LNNKTKLVVKRVRQAKRCHYSLRCKSRADLVVKTKEAGYTPTDLYLCKEHADEMIEKMLSLSNIKTTVKKIELIDEVNNKVIASGKPEDRKKSKNYMNRLEHILALVMDKELKTLTADDMSVFFIRENIEYYGKKIVEKMVEFYVYGDPYPKEEVKKKVTVSIEDGIYEFIDIVGMLGTGVEEITLNSQKVMYEAFGKVYKVQLGKEYQSFRSGNRMKVERGKAIVIAGKIEPSNKGESSAEIEKMIQKTKQEEIIEELKQKEEEKEEVKPVATRKKVVKKVVKKEVKKTKTRTPQKAKRRRTTK